jgi:hypothetical protein
MDKFDQKQPLAGLDTRVAGAVLDHTYVEAVARRVAELIANDAHEAAARRLVDAATLAAELGVERSWVYEHRDELAPVRLGTGSKPRLRFDVQAVRAALATRRISQPPSRETLGTGRGASPRRRPRRTNAKPTVGRVLAVRPRGSR